MSAGTKVTVTFSRQVIDDESSDLSWLEQHDDGMGEGFGEQAKARIEAYNRGDWHMIGVRAVATIRIERGWFRTNYQLKSAGLWGIESDSSEGYLRDVFIEECLQLRADIEALKQAEFKS